VEPIKAVIEAEPSFGYRTVANLLGFNKNTVQRIFRIKGWQVRKRPVGFLPRIEALPSEAARPDECCAANHPVRFGEQRLFQRRGVPHAAGDEVMKLVVADLAVPRRHGLHALAITCTDQSRYINRAHPRPRLVPKSVNKGSEPLLKIGPPALLHSRPSKTPTTHESRKMIQGNPKSARSLKNLPK
jgi:hypothetical protein